jgi:hypothetical protein
MLCITSIFKKKLYLFFDYYIYLHKKKGVIFISSAVNYQNG